MFLIMCSLQSFALGNSGDQDIAPFIKILGAPGASEQVTEGKCCARDHVPGAGGAGSGNMEPGLWRVSGGGDEEGGARREREQLRVRERGAIQVWRVV